MNRQQIERLHQLLGAVLDGLDGKPFVWGDGQRTSWVPMLEQHGITLVSGSRIKKLSYRLKRGAMPVGTAYFAAPIQRNVDLYVLEIQCVKVGEAVESEGEEVDDSEQLNLFERDAQAIS